MATKPTAALALLDNINGEPYNATANPLGLGAGGHRINFPAACDAIVETAGYVESLSGETAEYSVRALQWAEAEEDVNVVPGHFSAKHFAAKASASADRAQLGMAAAEQSAAAAATFNPNQFIRRDGVDFGPVDDRNVIMNPEGAYYRRSIQAAVSAGSSAFFTERWRVAALGSAMVRGSRTFAVFSFGNSPCLQLTGQSGGNTLRLGQISQRIENVHRLRGNVGFSAVLLGNPYQAITVSIYIRRWHSSGTEDLTTRQYFTLNPSQELAVNTSFILPALSNGEDPNSYIELVFEAEVHTSRYFNVTRIKLEPNVATPFQRFDLALEEIRCKRFSERVFFSISNEVSANALTRTIRVPFAIRKRITTPNVTIGTPSNGTASTNVASVAVVSGSLTDSDVQIAVTASAAGYLFCDRYIDVECEL